MLKVKSDAIYASLFHPPFVVGSGGEDKIAAFHATLVDFAVGRDGTDERHIPTAFFQTSLHLSGFQFTFIFEDIL